MAAHVYLITKSMVDQHFYNADGEMMFVPQQGNLRFVTEFGRIDIEPGEIAVIPRGVKFRVEIPSGPARGYICENYGGAFTLPERGPIGANCLANARDFLTPVAAYEDKDTPTELFVKWGGAAVRHQVAAFADRCGGVARQLRALQIRSAHLLADRRDRLRPSRSVDLHGVDVAVGNRGHRQHRLRDLPGALGGGGKHVPPALVSHEHHVGVHGADLRRLRRQAAKASRRAASACTTRCCRTARIAQAFDHASNSELKPVKLTGTMAFMFETRYPQRVTAHAATSATLQDDYADCWKGLEKRFDPNKP